MARRKATKMKGDRGVGLTRERLRRGDVELVEKAIADEHGHAAQPFRTVDTLMMMLRAGSITPAMKQAGDDFRAVFAVAALEPLRAADLARVPGTSGDMPLSARQAGARKEVWRALVALGGIASPAGSCVWHVIGCEWSLNDWSLREGWGGRPLSRQAASGILIGALGVLQGFYGL